MTPVSVFTFVCMQHFGVVIGLLLMLCKILICSICQDTLQFSLKNVVEKK